MIQAKDIAINLKLVEGKLKQHTAQLLHDHQLDLTPDQVLTIDVIWIFGSMSQTQLSQTLHKDKNSITKLVDTLESKGMLERKSLKKDRRTNIVSITPNALELIESTSQFRMLLLDEFFGKLTQEELDSFQSILKKILEED